MGPPMPDDVELGTLARDTVRIAAALGRQLGPAIEVEGCELATIKRLPSDAGLLVSYRVRLHDRSAGDRVNQLYSALVGPGSGGSARTAEDALARVEVGPPGIEVAELGATLLAFPNDPVLPSLATAFSAQAVAACLTHAHGRPVVVLDVETVPLKYDPGTGCTCRVSGSARVGDATERFDVIAKTHRSDRLARTFATMTRLAADPALRSGSWSVARPLFYDADRKLLWQETLRGQSFWTLYPHL